MAVAVEVDDERPPSTDLAPLSEEGDVDRDSCAPDRPSMSSSSICLRICWVMCDSEKVRFEGVWRLSRGVLYCSTVDLMAVVISSREVYGKQTFKIALPTNQLESAALGH